MFFTQNNAHKKTNRLLACARQGNGHILASIFAESYLNDNFGKEYRCIYILNYSFPKEKIEQKKYWFVYAVAHYINRLNKSISTKELIYDPICGPILFSIDVSALQVIEENSKLTCIYAVF